MNNEGNERRKGLSIKGYERDKERSNSKKDASMKSLETCQNLSIAFATKVSSSEDSSAVSIISVAYPVSQDL